MKQLLFSLFALFLISNFSYASFPVKREASKIEVVTENSSIDSLNAASTVAATAVADVSFGGFFLGLLLGLLGVGLAYIFSDDATFRRSSWYGLGVWLVILLLLGGL